MSVRVLFFASLRDAAGIAELNLPLTEPVSVDELLAGLGARLPAPALDALTAENVRIAINQTMAGPSLQIAPGDEVAFLPPVTGG